MSNKAITWALEQHGLRSAEKFVLVCMANYADELHCCYPSISALVADTEQDQKTVRANIHRLVASGHIQDSGDRRGKTGQIPVYRLAVFALFKTPENVTLPILGASQISSERLPDLDAQDSQNREADTSGIPQGTQGNTSLPENPTLEASDNPHRKPRIPTPPPPLPTCVPADAWADYLADRKERKKPLTTRAQLLGLRRLEELHARGQDLRLVIEQTIARGWSSFHEVRADRSAPAGGDGEASMGIKTWL